MLYFWHMIRNSKDTTEGTVMIGLVQGIRKHGRPQIQYHQMRWHLCIWPSLCSSEQKAMDTTLTILHSQLTPSDDDAWHMKAKSELHLFSNNVNGNMFMFETYNTLQQIIRIGEIDGESRHFWIFKIINLQALCYVKMIRSLR